MTNHNDGGKRPEKGRHGSQQKELAARHACDRQAVVVVA